VLTSREGLTATVLKSKPDMGKAGSMGHIWPVELFNQTCWISPNYINKTSSIFTSHSY